VIRSVNVAVIVGVAVPVHLAVHLNVTATADVHVDARRGRVP